MQGNQLWQTKYAQGPKISQISYPSKEDTVEYIYKYIYIKKKKKRKMLLYLYTPIVIKSA